MAVIQWNINGIYKHLPELQNILAYITPQIVCIQETHLKSSQQLKLNGYDIYRRDRQNYQQASWGGVLIMSKNSYYSKEITLITEMEAIAIQIHNPQTVTICNIYIPPDLSLNQIKLRELIQQLPKPYILTGDFNAHNIIWGSNHTDCRGKFLEDIFDNLVILNTDSPTRFNAGTGKFSNIDLTVCDPRIASNLSWEPLPDLHGSDHFPIKIENYLNNSTNTPTQPLIKKWNLNSENWETFTNTIKLNRAEFNERDDINQIVENFTNLITEIAETTLGTKTYKNKTKITCWWNRECAQASKDNKKTLYNYRKNKTVDNLVELKRARARARRIYRISKNESWIEYVSNINKDTPIRLVWDKINRIKGSKPPSQINTILTEGNILTHPLEIANALAKRFQKNSSNEYFTKEFLCKRKEEEDKPFIIEEDLNNPINSPITKTELIYSIKKLKNNTAPGPDNLPPEIIKKLPDETLNHLLKIYNKIWLDRSFPKQWREVTVIPIHKPNKNKNNPQNYRPIALSNTLCKVLERIVNNRLQWYLISNNILNNAQFGFRSRRSTTDSLSNLVTDIETAFINKQHLIAIFFDLEKAFETTWKLHILNSLKKNQLQGNILHFIKNFLSDRSFKVRCNGVTTERKTLINGTPQGAIISPTLFLIAINEITKNISFPVKATLFADDLVIYAKGKNLTSIETNLQNAINKIIDWTENTGFRISKTKTNAIHFCKFRRCQSNPILKIQESIIPYTNSIKFLGLTLDTKLSWAKHIENLCNDCHKRINILKTLSHYDWGAQREMLIIIYKTLIRSKIDYGSTVYRTASPKLLKKLDVLHHLSFRIITGAFRTSPTTSILCEAGELPLSYRREQLSLCYYIKLATDASNPTFHKFYHEENNHILVKNQTPLQSSFKAILTNLHFSIPKIQPSTIYTHPPWTMHRPIFNLELTRFQKFITSSSEYKVLFNEICDRYKQYSFIYTDGSKMQERTGAALVIGDVTSNYNLPNLISSYTAELHSIKSALEYIEVNSPVNYAICSDSLSSIHKIMDIYSQDSLVQNIQEKIHFYTQIHNRKVIIIWIPSHKGITGNEKADKAARGATAYINMPIPVYDIEAHIKNLIKTKWEMHWKNTTNNKLRAIKSDTLPWKATGNRRNQIIITRLRIGHTLTTHKYLLEKSHQEICSDCNLPITVNHILIECPKHHHHRKLYNIPNKIEDLLGQDENNLRNLIKFLTAIKLLSHI